VEEIWLASESVERYLGVAVGVVVTEFFAPCSGPFS
jgi:hypothetical protein